MRHSASIYTIVIRVEIDILLYYSAHFNTRSCLASTSFHLSSMFIIFCVWLRFYWLLDDLENEISESCRRPKRDRVSTSTFTRLSSTSKELSPFSEWLDVILNVDSKPSRVRRVEEKCDDEEGKVRHKPHDHQPQKLRIIIVVHRMSIHWERDDGLSHKIHHAWRQRRKMLRMKFPSFVAFSWKLHQHKSKPQNWFSAPFRQPFFNAYGWMSMRLI